MCPFGGARLQFARFCWGRKARQTYLLFYQGLPGRLNALDGNGLMRVWLVCADLVELELIVQQCLRIVDGLEGVQVLGLDKQVQDLLELRDVLVRVQKEVHQRLDVHDVRFQIGQVVQELVDCAHVVLVQDYVDQQDQELLIGLISQDLWSHASSARCGQGTRSRQRKAVAMINQATQERAKMARGGKGTRRKEEEHKAGAQGECGSRGRCPVKYEEVRVTSCAVASDEPFEQADMLRLEEEVADHRVHS